MMIVFYCLLLTFYVYAPLRYAGYPAGAGFAQTKHKAEYKRLMPLHMQP